MGMGIWVSGQGIAFNPQYLKRVVEESRAAGKEVLFVDVFATWCKPCHYMNDSVFTDVEVGNYFNKYFSSVQLDAEVGEGIGFAERYGVKTFPTYLLVDLEGKELGRHSGVLEPKALVIWAGAVMAQYQSDPKGRLREDAQK